MKPYVKSWLKASGIRAVKTVAQTAVATIGTSAVIGDVNWLMVAAPRCWLASCRCLPQWQACPRSKNRIANDNPRNPSRVPGIVDVFGVSLVIGLKSYFIT